MKQSWTLDQLGSQVAHALERGYEPAASGRVRAVPDRRTIRYYTTLGLVDRPSELRGRTAFYGRRHLLQLVAIKRLQGEGLSLREVQQRLTGLDERALAAVADLPEQGGAELVDVASGVGGPDEAGERGRADFWSARPPLAPAQPAPVEASAAPGVAPLRALELGAGVSLVLPGGPELGPKDLSALARAAEPLVRELERMGILLSGEVGAEDGADRSAE